MKTMKTLTVNGVTYTVTDPNAAVIDDAGVGAGAWSGKHIAELLCPAFSAAGKLVTCEPLQGYPLTVTGATGPVTRCGKNLFDDVAFYKENGFQQQEDGTWFGTQKNKTIFTNTAGMPGSFTLSGYGMRVGPSLVFQVYYTDGTSQYTSAVPTDKVGKMVYTTDDKKTVQKIDWLFRDFGSMYVRDFQLEYGAVATAYAPCTRETFAAGAEVPALKGVNTLWGQGEEIAVAGRLDPVAAYEKLAAKVGV